MADAGRALPNARVRRVMLAIQDVMGQSGLTTILRQASLQRFAGALPPANHEPGLHAAEYAALLQGEGLLGRRCFPVGRRDAHPSPPRIGRLAQTLPT